MEERVEIGLSRENWSEILGAINAREHELELELNKVRETRNYIERKLSGNETVKGGRNDIR